jgi:uncharacterized oxidoreductase
MVPAYVQNARSGDLVLNQNLHVALDSGSMLVCDARSGAGQVMAHEAMIMGIERAHAHGSCLVFLRNSHHIGRIGHWAEQCAAAGFASVHFVNVASEPAVVPFGGTSARLGTNPFSVGIPRGEAPPIVLDFATSRWAKGKVRVALNEGQRVPEGVLVDAQGQPATDPAVLFSEVPGALLPFGEHKGSGLSLVCELLAGALGGGKSQTGPRSSAAIINSMMSLIVSPDYIGTAGSFPRQIDEILSWFQSENEVRSGAVRLPGDPERENRARRLHDGIPIDRITLDQVRAAAEEVRLNLTRVLE